MCSVTITKIKSLARMRKLFLLSLLWLAQTGFSPLFAQGTQMSIREVTVTVGDKTGKGVDFNFPFRYGSWSPVQTIYTHEGTTITAAFKMVSPRTGRSEMKNSSVKLFVDYTVVHAGEKRTKSTEHIYYLDTKRAFESAETFSVKTTRYEVQVIRLKFKGVLGE